MASYFMRSEEIVTEDSGLALESLMNKIDRMGERVSDLSPQMTEIFFLPWVAAPVTRSQLFFCYLGGVFCLLQTLFSTLFTLSQAV